MTISTTYAPAQFTGTGDNSAQSVTYEALAQGDIVVTQRVTATGAETVMTLTTDYTIAFTGTVPSAFTVTPVDGATDFTTAMTWTVSRDTTDTQTTDLITNEALDGPTLESALDRLTLIAQENSYNVSRALHLPISDAALTTELPDSVERASEACEFDASGNVTTS